MLAMLQRVCWNREDWQKPTGEAKDGGYPGESGFGHEEWNFRVDDSYNGYVYGYLYYKVSKSAQQRADGHFQIYFWSLNPHSKERFLVGIYHDAVPIPETDFDQLNSYFKKNGIYERRATELIAAIPSMDRKKAEQEVRDAVMNRYLTFKCPHDNVQVLHPQPTLSSFYTGTIGGYFARPTFLSEPLNLVSRVSNKHTYVDRAAQNADNSPLAEDSYLRTSAATLKLILRMHSKLSNDFCQWLHARKMREIVQEVNRVDVEFVEGHQRYRAELKICHALGTRKAIREALGQLLEYNYYGDRAPADRFMIVLDNTPTEDDITYLRRLVHTFQIPLSVSWKSPEGFAVERLS